MDVNVLSRDVKPVRVEGREVKKIMELRVVTSSINAGVADLNLRHVLQVDSPVR